MDKVRPGECSRRMTPTNKVTPLRDGTELAACLAMTHRFAKVDASPVGEKHIVLTQWTQHAKRHRRHLRVFA